MPQLHKTTAGGATVVTAGGRTLPWDPLWQYVLGEHTDDEEDDDDSAGLSNKSSYDSYDDPYGLGGVSFDDTIQGHSFDHEPVDSFDSFENEEESVILHRKRYIPKNNDRDDINRLLANKRYDQILEALRLYDQLEEERQLRNEALFGTNLSKSQRIAALLGRGPSFQRCSSSSKGQSSQSLQPSSSRSIGMNQSKQTTSSSALPINLVELERSQKNLQQKVKQEAVDHSKTKITTNPTTISKKEQSKESIKKAPAPSSSSTPPRTSVSELVRTVSLVPQFPRNTSTVHSNKDTIALSKTISTNSKKMTSMMMPNPTMSSLSSSSSIPRANSISKSNEGFLRRNSSTTGKTKINFKTSNGMKVDEILDNRSFQNDGTNKGADTWVGWELDPDISSKFHHGNTDQFGVEQSSQIKSNQVEKKKRKNFLYKLMCHHNMNPNYQYDEESINRNSVTTHAISEASNIK
jgi:hypothetical protein